MKTNRFLSFLIVAIAYVFAAAVGVAVYLLLPFGVYLNLFIADFCATVAVFIFSLIFSNASIYDPYWSVQPIIITVAFTLNGFSPVALLFTVVIALWGVRLTVNWAYTFTNLTHQDWRYTMLKEKTGVIYPLVNFLGIHLFPTIVVYLCVAPAVTAITVGADITVGAVLSLTLSVLATVLQTVSDIQMHNYRKNRTTTFIRVGLWKYSRHPNYLGEILMWWGVGLGACFSVGFHPLLLVGATVNTLMFLFISIPMADKRQSQKDGWAEYKSATRMILPIYKKSK